jgi:peptide/nickel transport system substrate-binding protein
MASVNYRSWVTVLLAMLLVAGIAAPAAAAPPDQDEKPPQSGGVLKIAVVTDAGALGYTPEVRKTNDTLYARTALESFLRFDETGAPAPGLAVSWVVSPDQKSITFKLREGVKFHDETDWNAEAAKFNLEAYRTSDRPELKAVESIDVIDTYTVRLNLTQWDSTLLSNLAFFAGPIWSPTAYKEKGKDWLVTHPVGTGPFKFVEWVRDSVIRFERFDGYWQAGQPYLDGVEWYIIPDPLAQVAALQAGEVDVVVEVDPKNAQALLDKGTFYMNAVPYAGFGMAGDSIHPDSPFSDVRVRQAVNYAIDGPAIVDAITGGMYQSTNQFAVPGRWGYDPDVKGYPYNPEKAKALLAEAGYPDGFTAKLITHNKPTEIVDAFAAVQGYLAEVGIQTEIELVDTGQLDKLVVGGSWQNALFWTGVEFANPDTLSSIAGNFSDRCPLWKDMLHPEDYEAAITKAYEAPDFETKQKWTWEAQRLMNDEYALNTWLWAAMGISILNNRAHDTELFQPVSIQWAPENAWLEQ